MGKKKNQHVQQSMGQMVSRAALAQLGPDIEKMVKAYTNQIGQKLAVQMASTSETMFTRLVVLERLLMKHYNYTQDDLANMVADYEDEKENMATVDEIAQGDTVRLEIRLKAKDKEFKEFERMKLYDVGLGNTFGLEIESALIGMKTSESKTIEFGKDKGFVAELKVQRICRDLTPKVETTKETPVATTNA